MKLWTRRAFAAALAGPARSAADSLWAPGVRQVESSELVFPEGIRHVRVERSDSDRYQFLHDPAIAVHRGVLHAAWYNCPKEEIVGESLIRGRRSKDGGATWSAIEVIAADRSGEGAHYVPAQLLSHHGQLHAFVGKMTGHDLIVSCAVFTLDDTSGKWIARGEIAERFLPNTQPVRLADGNWLMAGRVSSRLGVKPLIPAVAISDGAQLTRPWHVVRLDAEEFAPGQHPETTVWVKGRELLAFTRNSLGPVPFSYTSNDSGRTWRKRSLPGFTAVTSKMYGGRLSNGQYYLLFNYPVQGDAAARNRAMLALAVTQPGTFLLSRVWKVQDAEGEGKPAASHYPCAIEQEGRLLVVYTASMGAAPRQCELASIPVASLRVS